MTISAPLRQSDWRMTASPLTPSVVVSHAKTSVSPDSEPALTEADQGYGLSTPVSFAHYDHASSLWRTSQLWLLEDLDVFSETWPRSGTMRGGIAYPRRRSALTINATGYGSSLIPTPTACDFKGSGLPREERGPNNNLRDWFKWHFNLQYPPVRAVEYMMGYPADHTACMASAMPSSQRSQKLSAKKS